MIADLYVKTPAFVWIAPHVTRLIFDRGRALGIDLYHFVVHGCAYHQAPEVHGKKWRIITSSPSLATSLKGRRCPGHKEHPETPGGRVDLPSRMCADVLEGVLWELRGQVGPFVKMWRPGLLVTISRARLLMQWVVPPLSRRSSPLGEGFSKSRR